MDSIQDGLPTRFVATAYAADREDAIRRFASASEGYSAADILFRNVAEPQTLHYFATVDEHDWQKFLDWSRQFAFES